MTKAEKVQLHRVLTRINKGLQEIKGVQTLQGNAINLIAIDVSNLFLVVKETQDQQRRSTPSLRVVKGGSRTKTPRPNR